MTELQIDYMRTQEQERANRASEEEKHRANTENERITESYNKVREQLERIRLDQHERELALKEIDSMLDRANAGDRSAYDELLEMDGKFTGQDWRSKLGYWLEEVTGNIVSGKKIYDIFEDIRYGPEERAWERMKNLKYLTSD